MNFTSLADPVPLQNQLEVKNTEVFYARCGRDLTFHAHFPTTPKVKAKIEYWHAQKNTSPISVLFMGFDTVSRSHFHRSLRNSFTRMRKLGFIDFRGYHSIVPYTLENLLSFLLGNIFCSICSCAAINIHFVRNDKGTTAQDLRSQLEHLL